MGAVFIIVITNVIGGYITGSTAVQDRFGAINQPKAPSSDADGVLDAVAAAIAAIVGFLVAVFQVLWTVFLVLFDMLSFRIAGLPQVIGLPIGVILSGIIVYSVAELIRGS